MEVQLYKHERFEGSGYKDEPINGVVKGATHHLLLEAVVDVGRRAYREEQNLPHHHRKFSLL